MYVWLISFCCSISCCRVTGGLTVQPPVISPTAPPQCLLKGDNILLGSSLGTLSPASFRHRLTPVSLFASVPGNTLERTNLAHNVRSSLQDPADGLPDEDITAIDEIPVYSINKPKSESLAVLKILDIQKEEQRKIMKKNRLIERLEEEGIIVKNLSIGAKHSRLKGITQFNKYSRFR